VSDVVPKTSLNNKIIIFQNVLDVLRIITKTVFVYQITKQDYDVYFDDPVLEVIDTKSLQIITRSTQEGDLYNLKNFKRSHGKVQVLPSSWLGGTRLSHITACSALLATNWGFSLFQNSQYHMSLSS
jgi:hypothetical protein